LILGVNLRIDDVPILSPIVSTEAERLIKKHKIDFLDCFQIVTIFARKVPSARSKLAVHFDNG